MRVSVTDVDSFRYWQGQEDATLEDILARLRREEPATEAMLRGSALHKALELAQPGEFDELEADGYHFLIPDDFSIALPEIRELKAEKVYDIDGISVTLVGKVDCIQGKRVEDHKTTTRFDPERLADTYQWRFYLDIFEADEFQWNVFLLREERKIPNTYTIRGLESFTQFRYPELERDCLVALREFVLFVDKYLEAA